MQGDGKYAWGDLKFSGNEWEEEWGDDGQDSVL